MERQPATPDYPLLPGEHLVRIEDHPPQLLPRVAPSALREIQRLADAKSPHDIGRNGPVVASMALEGDDKPEYLRLYEVVFGRDSLHVARFLIDTYPELARSTVLELAKLQGVSVNPASHEEPGRIVHEARQADDPIAIALTAERGWQWPFYGSVDATPEFVRTLANYCRQSEENVAFLATEFIDRRGHQRTIAFALEQATDWILARLARNKEGLIEYHATDHEAWRDSWDGYSDADGNLADPRNGIISTEVQITAYDALIDAAGLFEDFLDEPARAMMLYDRADELRSAIISNLWTEEKGGYFLLGAERNEDGSLHPLNVRTSNMGHALNSHLLEGDSPENVLMRKALIKQLRSPEMLAPAGIRTLATDEVRYRPGAYHNGSVWLWDTYYTIQGLLRHKERKFAHDLSNRLLCAIHDTRMFPEYVRGDDSNPISINTRSVIVHDSEAGRDNLVEQPPQEVQAWTVAAILAIKRHVMRGLEHTHPSESARAPQPPSHLKHILRKVRQQSRLAKPKQ